ncbi:MAG: DUF423 domain-containing protein [Pseudomonadota bacterium]
MITAIAAIVAFLSVALGAFGAHALEGKVDAKAIGWWETGTFYLLTHAIAALAIGLSAKDGWYQTGALTLLAGAVLFAATLFAMTLGAPRWLGAITPIGGAAMLAGWGMIVIAALRGA